MDLEGSVGSWARGENKVNRPSERDGGRTCLARERGRVGPGLG